MTFLQVALAATAIACLILAIALVRAPHGYEDRTGFHLGTPGQTHEHPGRDSGA